MANAGSWAMERYNSIDRSKRLRADRRTYEQDMEGTFKQKEKNKDKRIGLKGNEDRLTQALRNKGATTNQQIVAGTSKYIQDSKAGVNTARINAKTPYWNAAASQENANAKLLGTRNKAALAALPFASKLAERAATGPTPAAPQLNFDGTNPPAVTPETEYVNSEEKLVAPDGWVPPGIPSDGSAGGTGGWGNDFTRPKMKQGETLNDILQRKFGGKKGKKADMDSYFN